jgi:hypothetical protein
MAKSLVTVEGGLRMRLPRRSIAGGFLLFFLTFGALNDARAIPAFARKYGLRCSACHTAWPVLNDFGWRFKDNGYQLMNDRDSPIWQHPAYWPVTFRITPNWHRESNDKQPIDTPAGPNTSAATITQHGFDVSGLDILTGGTLEKNITFLLTPSADSTATFHFESAWARFDNLLHSTWLNIKMGKFELDNFLSEKRILGLSNNGGFYQNYHFAPLGDNNMWAQLGDNQLGLEWQGHSLNDHTRASAALVSSSDGNVNLVNANTYSGYFTVSQAFDVGGLGLQRVGAYAFIGQAPTYSLTSGGMPIPGSSLGNKSFYREGFVTDIYLRKVDVAVYYQHAGDSVYFGTATPANGILPGGARAPTWNGYIVEPHFVYNPHLVVFERNEFVRMSQQALATNAADLGDIDAYTVGFRYYPIMNSRAGLAFHNEYAWVRQRGTAVAPAMGDLTGSSLFFGVDFAF